MSLISELVEAFFGALSKSSSTSPVIQWFLRILALQQALEPDRWPVNHVLRDGEQFDFIVIGAGSAGAVVAARLSELRHWRVLLIEAGGDPPYASVLPSMFATMIQSKYDWDSKSYFDKGIGRSHENGILHLAHGKVLGGGSSINFEVYSRGKPVDYERWNRVAPGWDWPTVLHYFKKSEQFLDPKVLRKHRRLHNTGGPVKISRPKPNKCFQNRNDVILGSYREINIEPILEINGPETHGVTLPHFTFANGVRSSTAEAFIRPAKNKTNFFVARNSLASKVLIDHNAQAYGVEVILSSGKVIEIYSNKEVVVSAGAINSPKILMLSSIGPREELAKFGLKVISDLPVGRNLQDHPIVPIFIQGKRDLGTAVQNILGVTELHAYPVPMQTGFLTLNDSHSLNVRGRQLFQFFNIHIGAAASPLIYIACRSNYNEKFCLSVADANAVNELEMTLVIALNPASRGTVTIKSLDPLDKPVIHNGYLREEEDLISLEQATRNLMRRVNTRHYRQVNASLAKLEVTGCEKYLRYTPKYLKCYIKSVIGTMYHPSGTCAMGVNGVVDEKLRVHGVRGLRVADASIMPYITSGNTNAPSMMIGERAADFIKMEHLNENEI